jgi:hypothetical protein
MAGIMEDAAGFGQSPREAYFDGRHGSDSDESSCLRAYHVILSMLHRCHSGSGKPPAGCFGFAALRLRGLPFRATQQDVVAFFTHHGVADYIAEGQGAVRMVLMHRRKPTGQAVVMMKSQSAADAVQKVLQSHWMGNRYIEVFAYDDWGTDGMRDLAGRRLFNLAWLEMPCTPVIPPAAPLTLQGVHAQGPRAVFVDPARPILRPRDPELSQQSKHSRQSTRSMPPTEFFPRVLDVPPRWMVAQAVYGGEAQCGNWRKRGRWRDGTRLVQFLAMCAGAVESR